MFYLKGNKIAEIKKSTHCGSNTLIAERKCLLSSAYHTELRLHKTIIVNNFNSLTIMNEVKSICENYEF